MLQIGLKGKVSLITGVSSGIGAGIALEMARAGADVSGCDRGERDETFLQVMRGQDVGALYTQCDVTKPDELQLLVNGTIERFGRLDVLVSNAGANIFTGASATEESGWQHNMDLNLSSHWRLARLCKPYLEKSGGVIIVMSSNHAFSTMPGCFPYNVAKTALTGLVRSLAIEWGPAIRTVGIAPGFIDTSGNQGWFDSFPDPQGERQRTIDMHPVKRLGTAEEIGGWCVFLSSPYAAFASGTTYLVDGGRSALMQDQ